VRRRAEQGGVDMALLIILAFALMALIEIPRLIRAGRKKDLVWFSVFSLIGFVLMMLLSAGVAIPGPIKLTMDFFDLIHLHYGH
jgi:hypothetical protein